MEMWAECERSPGSGAERERYPVNVRYMRDFRADFGALGRVRGLLPMCHSKETLNKSLLLMYCESRYHKQRGLDETADVGDGGRV